MLSEQDQHRLNAIARELHEDDRRFCLAVQAGRPRAPREYRQRWIRLLLLTAVAVSLFTTAVAAGNSVALVVAVVISTVGGVLVQLQSPDRPWRRRTLFGRRRR
jgi:Protein of unknown function (DUF3040)